MCVWLSRCQITIQHPASQPSEPSSQSKCSKLSHQFIANQPHVLPLPFYVIRVSLYFYSGLLLYFIGVRHLQLSRSLIVFFVRVSHYILLDSIIIFLSGLVIIFYQGHCSYQDQPQYFYQGQSLHFISQTFYFYQSKSLYFINVSHCIYHVQSLYFLSKASNYIYQGKSLYFYHGQTLQLSRRVIIFFIMVSHYIYQGQHAKEEEIRRVGSVRTLYKGAPWCQIELPRACVYINIYYISVKLHPNRTDRVHPHRSSPNTTIQRLTDILIAWTAWIQSYPI